MPEMARNKDRLRYCVDGLFILDKKCVYDIMGIVTDFLTI